MTLSGATTPGQSGLGSDGNERVLRIPQFSITGTSPSHCLALFAGHSFEGSHRSAENRSVYSTAPTDWTTHLGIEQAHRCLTLVI